MVSPEVASSSRAARSRHHRFNSNVNKVTKVGLCIQDTSAWCLWAFMSRWGFHQQPRLRCPVFPQGWVTDMRSASPQDHVSIGFATPGAGDTNEQLRRQSCWRVSGSQLWGDLNVPFVMSRCCCPSVIFFRLLIMCGTIIGHLISIDFFLKFTCTILHETIQKRTVIRSWNHSCCFFKHVAFWELNLDLEILYWSRRKFRNLVTAT